MRRLAAFVAGRSRFALVAAVAIASAASILAANVSRSTLESNRLLELQSEASRLSTEVMSLTLNGNVMGATTLLGYIEESLKREARGELAPNNSDVTRVLKGITQTGTADGAFVVGNNGIIGSSFGQGKSSTGVDVRFRPYFASAMKGNQSVYAAVGTTTGMPTLFFAAPLHAGETPNTPIIGAVVGRGSITPIKKLLDQKSCTALLLSPQGLVFSSNRSEWVGHVSGNLTAEKFKEIRDLRQFGTMFDESTPVSLPISTDFGIRNMQRRPHAVARASVAWNDPHGEWAVVLIEDLSQSVDRWRWLDVAVVVGLSTFVLCALVIRLLVARHTRELDRQRIEQYAKDQEASARRSNQRAEVALRLQGAKSVEEIASTFLAECHRIFGALQGCIYLRKEGDRMRLAAAYAISADIPAEVGVDDGLMGKSLAERSSRLLTVSATEPWTIRTSLGQSPPTAVLISPLALDDRQLGAIEVGLPTMPDRDRQKLFDELSSLLAYNIGIRLPSNQVPTGPVCREAVEVADAIAD